jgi:hypothetical protein
MAVELAAWPLIRKIQLLHLVVRVRLLIFEQAQTSCTLAAQQISLAVEAVVLLHNLKKKQSDQGHIVLHAATPNND